MRITGTLCKQNAQRLFKQFLDKRRTLRPVNTRIPRQIREKNLNVYDANEFFKEKSSFDFAKYIPIVAEAHVQTESAYIVPKKVRLTEGEIQAQLLTNSAYANRLPEDYKEKLKKTKVTDAEQQWASKRLKILEHESFQELLPRRIDEKRPWHRFPRDYGCGNERRTNQLLTVFNDFVRIGSEERDLHKVSTDELTCQYLRPTEVPYVFEGECSAATLTRKPLDQVSKEAPRIVLQTMYPALPEIDLKKRLTYENVTKTVLKPGGEFHLHTIFVNGTYEASWKPHELLGLAMLQTYTFAASTAAVSQNSSRKQVLQCIYHDMENIGFLVFQLNNFGVTDGSQEAERNQFWHSVTTICDDKGEFNESALRHLKVFHST